MHPEKTVPDLLALDCAAESDRIAASLRAYLQKNRRRGLVLGLSGGIDSTVTAALAVRAVGRDRVFGLHMPECQSEDATLVLSRTVARWLTIPDALEDITPLLEAAGFFRRYVEAARKVIPAFDDSWKSKVVIHATGGSQTFSYFSLVGQAPDGRNVTARLSLEAYLEIVAATNFKQRTRKMLEYYHADRLNFAVAGTPNRLEYDQGFFVKNGDGAADVKPIAHLYKTQVYRLAEYLGVPAEIRRRPPTTDTYSLPQGQDEFYFALPYQQMDLCLFGKNHGLPADGVAKAAGLDVPVVERVWADIDRKRATTRYLHLKPVLVESVPKFPPEHLFSPSLPIPQSNMSDTKREIRHFIVETFLFGQDSGLTDETSFLEQGIVDSTGVLELVAHLEKTYAIKVKDEELTPDNLDSINSIADFLAKKRA